ncbi:hypothetical protein C0Q70_17195 [Pomacea canaliculata]|uniref:40S ribosomal protein S12 n=1 Tax=Pomacea canaliculata TaxID=400727 RepID=A0A2T7NRX0_POMCA|nr:hypothetical protein C0Q70_17195 [Pomacea canaliculata]
MSDAEGDDTQPQAAGSMDIYTAVQEVLKTALIHDGLARGANEQQRLLISANLYIPATTGSPVHSQQSVNEPMYTKLIEALCAEHGINLLKVDDSKKLGEWAGLCKIDKEGKARKVNGCGVVVVKDYGKESQALDVLNEYFRSKK